jgi:hypothetical protein
MILQSATDSLMLAADSQYDSLLQRGNSIMAALITHGHLKEIITTGQIVIGGDPDSVEGIKYDFRLGSKFLKASLERPVDYNVSMVRRSLKQKSNLEKLFLLCLSNG